LLCVSALVLSACGDSAKLPEDATIGPNPTLPEPRTSLIPTVDIAPAKGWPDGTTPAPASGLAVTALAKGLDHPRWLFVLPNGDVLVAESNAPERPERKGPKTFVMNMVMKRAGAAAPSANRITLLRDTDGDGVAETRTVFLKGLNSPFGMALIGNDFYVANTDAVMRFPYKEGATEIAEPGVKVADLPGGPLNHHWTKGLTASPDGTKLYASVGSNSNVAENGIEKEEQRAAILEIDVRTGQSRVFAGGLRNPVGIAFHPQSNELWAVVNERDEIGSDLVPDYLRERRRLLWLALQLFRQACRQARAAGASRPCREGDRAGLLARQPCRAARLYILCRRCTARNLSQRRLRRSARLVESNAAQRLQGDLRAVQGRQAGRQAPRRADRLRQQGRRCVWAPGRRRDGQKGCVAHRRRCRQRRMACRAFRSPQSDMMTAKLTDIVLGM
jgi:Glucose / Sorbosone dehydrogenase